MESSNKIPKSEYYNVFNYHYSDGLTYKQIGDMYGVSRSLIQKIFNRNNKKAITRRPVTENLDVDYIKNLHIKDGKTLVEISKITGIHENTIKNFFKINNIPIYNNKLIQIDNETEQYILNLYEINHMSIRQIYESTGIARHKISQILKRNGLNTQRTKKDLIDIDQIKKLHYEENQTIKYISKYFNVSPDFISGIIKEFGDGIIYHQHKMMNLDHEKIFDMHYNEEMPITQISKEFNVSESLIKSVFNYHDKQNKRFYSSQAEKDITNFLKTFSDDFEKNRRIIPNTELDIYSEKSKFAVEYNGLYWHDCLKIGKNYHYDKMKKCQNLGINIINIFEDEWIYNSDIVKSILKSKLGVSDKIIYARNCIFQEYNDKNEVREFLDENHIQGQPKSFKYAFWLIYNNEKIALITYGKHHRKNDDRLVLSRLCFLKHTNVIGGSSKLFINSLKYFDNDIITWSDNRWSEGYVYRQMGFCLDGELKPDYHYTKKDKRFNKQSFRKKDIGCPSNIKEQDFMRDLGYGIIYDCGKKRWVYERNV